MFPRLLLPCLALLPFAVLAERSSRDDNADAPPSTAEQERAMFHLPPGFEIQLVADETQIQKPMNLNFDAAGRLWVTGSELYPWPAKVDALGQPIAAFEETWKSMSGAFDAKKAPLPPERATDTVRVLSDFGPDGRARKVEVFADGLNIPVGIMPLPRQPGAKGDSVIVFSIPKIWRLTDTDGDGRADLREPLYGDFGFRDTHGMSSNYLYWIDGWIYGCHGFANHSLVKDASGRVTEMNSGNTYRFRPDGSRFEIYTHGQTNPFGLAVDDWGNFYSADSHSKPVMMLLPGGYYAGIGKTHDGLGFAPTIMDHDHGSSAIAGVAWYGAKQFPEEFYGNTFNGNPVTRRINRDRYEWHGSTPKAIEMPDFLTCDDLWFRPVQVKLGPDGALWIADFYNPIIGHYEQPLADPRRDHKHGRIWRIVWRGEKADAPFPTLPDLTKLDAKALIEKLGDANITTRTLATNELVERVGASAAAEIKSFFTSAIEGQNEIVGEQPFPRRAGLLNEAASACALYALFRLGQDRLEWAINGIPAPSQILYTHAARLCVEYWTEWARTPRSKDDPFEYEVGHWRNTKVADYSGAKADISEDGPVGCRFASEVLAAQALMGDGRTLVFLCLAYAERVPSDDAMLRYAVRSAVRDILKLPGYYAYATEFAQDYPEHLALFADVSLAISTPESAQFLFTYLQRSKFIAPRSEEYLRHATLYLPEEKLSELGPLVKLLGEMPLSQRLALTDGLQQAVRERKCELPQEIASWAKDTMFSALDSADVPVSNRAIAALRDVTWPEKIAPLEKIVFDSKQSGARRTLALEAAVNVGDGVALAKRALAEASSMPLQKKAAELLGDVARLSRAASGEEAALESRATLLAALPTAPTELALSIVASLAKTDADFAALLDLLEAGKASPAPLRNRLIAILITKRTDALQARADTLTKNLPPEDARLDQVIADRVKAFGAAKADAEKGAQVFAQQCAVCHRFRGQGGNVGPNLDGVVARGAHRLIEDILDPNRNVDPTFRQTTLELKDGRMLIGVNLREEGNTVLLTDAAGQTQSTPKETVKTQTQSRLSLMPPAFETMIPAEDFNALLSYLLR